jgi:hypothetical protein
MISPAARQFILRYWNPKAIREREKGLKKRAPEEEKVPSVTEVGETLIEELEAEVA